LAEPLDIVHALYCGFFEKGIEYFFPEAALRRTGALAIPSPALVIATGTDGSVDLDWMDRRYSLQLPGRPLTENQLRLLGAIGAVLSARFRSIFHAVSAAATSLLFEGLAEDRYVSAFLDYVPYLDAGSLPAGRDVLADAIEVLRESSMITYENRRVATGVLLLSRNAGKRALPEGAVPYSSGLVQIKSFHRLCDGLKTVFLVNHNGMLIDLVDVRQWAEERDGIGLPAPASARYRAHAQSTLHDGHICLVLTRNGEIKVFADGAQMFSFVEGRWRLTDSAEKYREWQTAIGDEQLGELLFTTALNLAEHRRGGLFLVVDDPGRACDLLSRSDLLSSDAALAYAGTGKPRIHYLLRGKRVLDLEPALLESMARMDGAIVLDRESNLLAFGAILRHQRMRDPVSTEGGRTTAAINSSHFGSVLKISEDGLISFFRKGIEVWTI
jgi:hypothetical protein